MLIIAEIGTSHEGSKQKAFELIDAAVEAGADAIKFQWVYADEILHPNTGYVALPTGNIRLYDRFKQLECDKSFYKEMLDYVHSKGCKFCCSPFGIRSLKELFEIKPDIIKIASPELNHYPMLQLLRDLRSEQIRNGETPVPVILSSGVSKINDIEKALEITGKDGVSLLHCITSYPAPEQEYNLRVIENLKAIFGVECGVSDHSLSPVLVPSLSTVCGGSIIEKHITLSRQTDGLDDPVALEPEQFSLMVYVVKQCEVSLLRYGKELALKRILEQLSEQFNPELVQKVLGDGFKQLAPAELNNYGRTNRSLHFMEDMKKGDILTAEKIGILRTEKELTPGIGPEFYNDVTGAKLVCDVCAGEGIEFKHLISKI